MARTKKGAKKAAPNGNAKPTDDAPDTTNVEETENENSETTTTPTSNGSTEANKLAKDFAKFQLSDRTVTGYLTSLEKSRDVKIEQFSVSTHDTFSSLILVWNSIGEEDMVFLDLMVAESPHC